MLNTSFSNKTQITNKKNIFYFIGSNSVQCILHIKPDSVWLEQ